MPLLARCRTKRLLSMPRSWTCKSSSLTGNQRRFSPTPMPTFPAAKAKSRMQTWLSPNAPTRRAPDTFAATAQLGERKCCCRRRLVSPTVTRSHQCAARLWLESSLSSRDMATTSSFEDTGWQAMVMSVCACVSICKLHTYRTVEHILPFVATLLNVSFQGRGVQWLEQFEAAQQFPGYGHDCAPIVEFTAVLYQCQKSTASGKRLC